MAVYDRLYRGFGGTLAPAWSRFLVISRYAFADVFRSRPFLMFFVGCLVWPLACAVIVYLHYNIEALTILDLQALDLLKIDTTFFRVVFMRPQTTLALFLALIVGPALISPDLRNNAMPLYLSRPLSRRDYVAGKLLVLVTLMSLITWVPGLGLFCLQVLLTGRVWLMEHARVGLALFFGSWVWILVLALPTLAISAWVKWKPWARIIFLGLLIGMTAVGQIFKTIYDTWLGSLLVLDDLMAVVWGQLFGARSSLELPPLVAWLMIAFVCAGSSWLLFRRIRAYEVVT